MRLIAPLLLLGLVLTGPAAAVECEELTRAMRLEVPGCRLFISRLPDFENLPGGSAVTAPDHTFGCGQKAGTGMLWWYVQRLLDVLIDFEDIPPPDGPSGAEDVRPSPPDTVLAS